MVWYGMVWYGMVWYGMVWLGGAVYLCEKILHNINMILKILKFKTSKINEKNRFRIFRTRIKRAFTSLRTLLVLVRNDYSVGLPSVLSF